MAKFLIVYATEEGQTKKIAEFMKSEIFQMGHSVEIFNCKRINDLIISGSEGYQGVIIGGSVHNGHFSDLLRHWVKLNSSALSTVSAAFFSVCLGILDKGLVAKDEEHRIVIDFFDEMSWYPEKTTIFAGALKYSKYNWFTKWFMKRIAAKAGGGTDSSKDYEYTAWNEVRQFTKEFVAESIKGKNSLSQESRMINPKRIFS